MRKLDLTGQKFKRLIAIEICGKAPNGAYLWRCNCDCGGSKIVPAASLKSGYVGSCGCYSKEHPSNTKHGDKGKSLYIIWKAMRERCNTKSYPKYRIYGGRGISICSEWNKYESFKEWAINNRYIDGLSIERIDVNGNYSPSNCTWIPLKHQARNTRKTIYVEDEFGNRLPLWKFAKDNNISHKLADGRMRTGKIKRV
jgi:hypothetical protein